MGLLVINIGKVRGGRVVMFKGGRVVTFKGRGGGGMGNKFIGLETWGGGGEWVGVHH